MRPAREEVAVLGSGSAGAGPVRLVTAVQLVCSSCQSVFVETRSRVGQQAQVVWEQLLQGPLVALHGVLLGDAQRAGKHSRIARIRDASAAAAFGQHPASLVAQGLKHERCAAPWPGTQPRRSPRAACPLHTFLTADSNSVPRASALALQGVRHDRRRPLLRARHCRVRQALAVLRGGGGGAGQVGVHTEGPSSNHRCRRCPRPVAHSPPALLLPRLAKQASDQGWQTWAALHKLPHVRHSNPPPSTNLAHGLACIQDGVALAEEVLALAPHRARAHTGAALGLGRLALYTQDTRQRVALCNRIRREAETALRLDPTDDAAHHVLGRWHMEVAGLNPVVRLVVRHVYGGDIQASTAQALRHFTQARELAPQRLAHAAEMGKARRLSVCCPPLARVADPCVSCLLSCS